MFNFNTDIIKLEKARNAVWGQTSDIQRNYFMISLVLSQSQTTTILLTNVVVKILKNKF